MTDIEKNKYLDKVAIAVMQSIIIKQGLPTSYHWGNNQKDTHPEFCEKVYKIAEAMLKYKMKNK